MNINKRVVERYRGESYHIRVSEIAGYSGRSQAVEALARSLMHPHRDLAYLGARDPEADLMIGISSLHHGG